MDDWYNEGNQSRSSSSSGSLYGIIGVPFYSSHNSCRHKSIYEEDYAELQTVGEAKQTNHLFRHENEDFGHEMSEFNKVHMQVDMDLILKQKELEEMLASEQWHPSSTSSPLQSLSTGSSGNSSFGNYSISSSVHCPFAKASYHQGAQPQSSSTFTPAYNETMFLHEKRMEIEVKETISAIFSSPSSSSTPSILVTHHSGFKPYNSAPTIFRTRNTSGGQKMIKDSISTLRRINLMRDEEEGQESRQSTHTISERRRREKLNANLWELRQLLPPCCKKDKASVLCKTKDYLESIKSQIFELEKNNQMLEMHLSASADHKEDSSRSTGSSMNVRIVEAFEPVTGIKRISVKITVQIGCDLLEIVLLALEYLKEKRAINFVSLDAKTCMHQKIILTSATLMFDIKGSDWDEVSFTQGMRRAVYVANLCT